MLKRIKPEQVQLGMFIESVDGIWVGTSFWRSRFLLACPKDVDKLKASKAKGIVINTDVGVDVGIALRDRNSSTLSTKDQLIRALKTIEQSRPLILEMFDDARMGSSVSVYNAMQTVGQIAACMTDNARALIEVSRLKKRDEYTFLHSIAVTALMIHLGRSLKIDDQTAQSLGMGGLLHDVGKVKIPLDVLNRAGPLTDCEMALVRRHPSDGYDLLSCQRDIPATVLDICLHHHERLDGTGYPKGLSGNQISLPVRIASICDVYDALTSKRAYKKAWAPVDAAKFMFKQDGQFDHALLRLFFHSMNF